MRKNGLILLNYPFINTVSKVPVGKGVTLYVFGVIVTADEVPAVGEGVKKNEFDVNLTDDGDGEDVTNGEGVNENVLGDGKLTLVMRMVITMKVSSSFAFFSRALHFPV